MARGPASRAGKGAGPTLVLGVDGCRAGWLWISITRGRWAMGVAPKFASLLEPLPRDAVVFVDMPIGLREASLEPRGCDREARKLLGRGRASSVFPAPPRAILDCPGYEEALRRCRDLTGGGISRQAFHIMPRVRELDRLLRTRARERRRVRESHPEVVFRGLAGHPAAHPKKTEAGYRERLALLERHVPEAGALVEMALERYRRRDVARDDIVDALALAVAAAAGPRRWRTLPARPVRDEAGLAMEMVWIPGRPPGRGVWRGAGRARARGGFGAGAG